MMGGSFNAHSQQATSSVSLFNFYPIEFIRGFLCVIFIVIMALMDGIN